MKLLEKVKKAMCFLIYKEIEDRYDGNFSRAARTLGIARTTLRDVVHGKSSDEKLEEIFAMAFQGKDPERLWEVVINLSHKQSDLRFSIYLQEFC